MSDSPHDIKPLPDRGGPGTDAEAGSVRAIFFVVAGILAISVNDASIKFLSGDYPLHQTVFVRSLIALAISSVFLALEGGPSLLKTKTPGLHLLRASLIVMANMLFFCGLAVLPLAEVTALFFVAPLLITLLAVPVLGERIGPRRLAAILVGLAGVIVMMQPWASQTDAQGQRWALALPVLAAACYSGMQVLTRKLGVASRASAMAIYIQATFLIVSLGFYVAVGDGRLAENVEHPALVFLLRAWVWPSAQDWPVFILVGVMSGFVGYFMSQAYRIGDPSTVAIYEYLLLPLSVVWGFAFWGEVPDGPAFSGIVLIVGAGLYVFFRERQRSSPLAGRQPQRRG